jgi:peptidoglycan/xylan/chitin deacetylase (PgdA/CDA1 family)
MKSQAVPATNHRRVHPAAHVRDVNTGEGATPRIVTTSWDDGDPSDLRVAEMLAARNLSGTFYIPVKGHHKYSRMTSAEMLELDSLGFEVGAHGVSSPNLPACDPQQLLVEVEGGKKRLEDDLGKRVSMFAYPRGRHNGKVIAALKQAGFAGARTTAMLARARAFDPFRMPTTVHAFPHTRFAYFRNLRRAWTVSRAWTYATHLRSADNWVELAKILFDSVVQDGGLWHLYGHSWEIEELRLWDGLKEVLDYVSSRTGVSYLANGAIVKDTVVGRRVDAQCCTLATTDTNRGER